jgi:predicted RNA-binding protein YlxR (DUF448 family)
MEDAIEREETGPERTCIVTRQKAPRNALLRFVLAPDGTVIVDLKGSLPGRGVWVTPTRASVAEAVRKKVFARGLRASAKTAPDLPEIVEDLLIRRAREALSLANKAGQLVTGFGKVEEALQRRRVLAVIHASDAAPDGVRKLSGSVLHGGPAGADGKKVLSPLPSDDLSLALGRAHVIHAALLDGSAAAACLERLEFLEAYRRGSSAGDQVIDISKR